MSMKEDILSFHMSHEPSKSVTMFFVWTISNIDNFPIVSIGKKFTFKNDHQFWSDLCSLPQGTII